MTKARARLGGGPAPEPYGGLGLRQTRCHRAGVASGDQTPCAWWFCRHRYRSPAWDTVAPTS